MFCEPGGDAFLWNLREQLHKEETAQSWQRGPALWLSFLRSSPNRANRDNQRSPLLLRRDRPGLPKDVAVRVPGFYNYGMRTLGHRERGVDIGCTASVVVD
jgi:hypothetical protein